MQTLAAAIEAARKRKPKARRAPEHALHVAVARYLALALKPPVWWSSIDHGAGKMSAAAAGRRKARGVRKGLPDILVMSPIDDTGTIVLGIELKAGNGRQSDAQRDLEEAFLGCEAEYTVCRSIADVADALKACGIPVHARPA